MELTRPQKQKVWGWPGVVNIVLGGMATGFYLLSSLLAVLPNRTPGVSQSIGFKLLAAILAGLGFLTLMVEAGQPLRVWHLFRRLHRSWMSRETLAGVAFIMAAGLDWLFPQRVLWALGAVAAIGLMTSQGFIFYRVRTVRTWNTPLVPLLFLTSGFAMGSGLMLLAALGEAAPGGRSAAVALVCVMLDLAIWLLYLYGAHHVAFREATGALRRPIYLIFTVGLGHLIPALLLLVALGIEAGAVLWRVITALAGLAIIVGGISQKAGIILKAGYLRGIVLGGPRDSAQNPNLACSPSSPAMHQNGRPGSL